MSVNLFTKSINGYNRSEVDNYLLELSAKNERMRRDYEKKLEILESENAKLKRQLFEAVSLSENDKDDADKEDKNEAVVTDKCSDNAEILEKSKKYDEISRSLGEMMLKAQATADDIVNGAKKQADEIFSSAIESISELRRSVSDASRNE